jgi:hypothetical protein
VPVIVQCKSVTTYFLYVTSTWKSETSETFDVKSWRVEGRGSGGGGVVHDTAMCYV